MSIRNRISQFLKSIFCSKGGILLGRVSGAGPSQEINIGAGLQLTGTTLSATGGGGQSVLQISTIPNASITIAGTFTDGFGHTIVFPTLLPIVMLNGRPAFQSEDRNYRLLWDGAGSWLLQEYLYGSTWASADDVQSPDLATTWFPYSANTGIPVVTALGGVLPDAVGQLARVGNEFPYRWFIAEQELKTGWQEMVSIPFLRTTGNDSGLSELVLNSKAGFPPILTMVSPSGTKGQITTPNAFGLDRSFYLPDKDGTIGILPEYPNSSIANSYVSIGDSWWDTTLNKARTRMS